MVLGDTARVRSSWGSRHRHLARNSAEGGCTYTIYAHLRPTCSALKLGISFCQVTISPFTRLEFIDLKLLRSMKNVNA